ncbi:MAG: alanine/ornithine racemase family PLP-dependent enzyme [Firmicutes bacterium]|nr:alanine/ornithine racemase family PLP-dependent enzyme [Bacillota bacterium]MDH7496570.1 alanine/ornithine racemase family PLP-dependent enzyme [Bacillota bacterium]
MSVSVPGAAPRVEISLDKVEENARTVVEMCRRHGIEVAGVSKVTCGDPDVAKAMLRGGVRWIADSRLANLARLRDAAVGCETVLLRAPMLCEATKAVELADMSLISSIETARALGEAARARGVEHKVILMVDVGDLREGVLPDVAVDAAARVSRVEGIGLHGIGTNVACYGGVVPTRENMSVLLHLRDRIRADLGLDLEVISGGNSSVLPLVAAGQVPQGVNQLRIGESMLLGRDVTHRRPLPGMHLDAFVFVAEAIEVARKPSVPQGQVGQDAFGRVRVFRDRGIRRRAILACGRQDVDPEGLAPLEAGIEVLGASSDHLILDVEDADREIKVGDEVRFTLSYGCLLAAMTSPYVHKVFVGS